MNEQRTYEGWSSRESWALALWLNNDEGLNDTALDYAKTAWEEHAEDGEGRYVTASDCLADTFKNWIEEDLFTLENIAGNEALFNMLTDIGSLYRIDYQEVAESFIDDIVENEKVSA